MSSLESTTSCSLNLISASYKDFSILYREKKDQKPKKQTLADGFYRVVNNFCRGVKFSPDGVHLATNSNDRTIRIFKTPTNLESTEHESCGQELTSIQRINEASIIYDFDWHPYTGPSDASCSNFIATCSQRSPIHLWNSCTNNLVATFYARDYANEVESIYSLAFAGFLGQNIIAGLNQYVALFDINRPGSVFSKSDFVKECRKLDGAYYQRPQDGIVSCIATSSVEPNLFIAGSYGKQIGLYDIREPLQPEHLLTGQLGGISHVKFSPLGQHIFSAGRKDKEILCWDFRDLGRVCQTYNREASTNQKISFDISSDNSLLASGSSKGEILLWSLAGNYESNEPVSIHTDAHSDCVNGISFHPDCDKIIASVSGQRHFPTLAHDSSASSESDDDAGCKSAQDISSKKRIFVKKFRAENSLKLWSASDVN